MSRGDLLCENYFQACSKVPPQQIICSGVPHELISDYRSNLKKEVVTLLEKYRIQHHMLSLYHPLTDGAIEAANKNIKMIVEENDEEL